MTKIKNKKWPVVTLIIALVAVYNLLPVLNSAGAVDSISDAKDLITDSDPGETADHTITFTTGTSTAIGGYIDVVLDDDGAGGSFEALADGDITCPGSMTGTAVITRAVDEDTARCTATGVVASGSKQIVLNDIVNPSAEDEYIVSIYHYTSGDVLLERVTIYVAIIEDILMTAKVDSTLDFVISGVNSGTIVNGELCNANTSATTTPFGTLQTGAMSSTTVCQRLQVDTNADDGFSVTVWQDGELTSESSSNINSFDNSTDGTGSTTPHAWAAPLASIDDEWTYGHMGFTSQDDSLSWGGVAQYNDPFGDKLFMGFTGTTPVEVMYHDGPVTSDIDHKGSTYIAYKAQISVLQEAGDYQSTLTYICTPQF